MLVILVALGVAYVAFGRPMIRSINPQEGLIGTTVTITGRGFAGQNDIGFALEGEGQWKAAYIDTVISRDGLTITFTIPDIMGACPMTQLDNEICPLIDLYPPPGQTEVWVANARGTSNRVRFTILPEYRDQELESWEQQLSPRLNDLVNKGRCASVGMGVRHKERRIALDASDTKCKEAMLQETDRLGIPRDVLTITLPEDS